MQYARKQYMDQLIRKKDNGRIKVITGLRRCGKSYLLFTLYRQYLLENGVGEDQIIGLALDEIDNARYRNPFELNGVLPCPTLVPLPEREDFLSGQAPPQPLNGTAFSPGILFRRMGRGQPGLEGSGRGYHHPPGHRTDPPGQHRPFPQRREAHAPGAPRHPGLAGGERLRAGAGAGPAAAGGDPPGRHRPPVPRKVSVPGRPARPAAPGAQLRSQGWSPGFLHVPGEKEPFCAIVSSRGAGDPFPCRAFRYPPPAIRRAFFVDLKGPEAYTVLLEKPFPPQYGGGERQRKKSRRAREGQEWQGASFAGTDRTC